MTMNRPPSGTRRTRVHVVSDVHGNVRDLARAGEGADALICLGDLVLFVDYADHSRGILPDLFGAENARRLVSLRTERRYEEARALGARLWAGVDGDRTEVIEQAVRRQYAELFAAFPTPTYATYGNVDVPHLWPEFAREGTVVLDGQRVQIGGRVFGFVGGGLRSPMRSGHEIGDEEYAAKIEAVGEVDVLCTHIPRTCPNSSTTPSPAASSAAAALCWTPSAAPAPATPFSAMCTSRWCAACASAPPSASTWATSRARARPGSSSGDHGHAPGPRAAVTRDAHMRPQGRGGPGRSRHVRRWGGGRRPSAR